MNVSTKDELKMRIACMRVVDAVEAEWPDSGKDLRAYINFIADERMRLYELNVHLSAEKLD